MRFELFLGMRSVGTASWEDGWITLRIRDAGERRFLLRHFEGPLSRQGAEDVRFRPEGFTRERFESTCLDLRARGYRVASRPAR